MKLVIASNNKGKIREYKQILEKHGYEVMSQSEAGLSLDVEETGTTFAENSALKARAAYKELGCAVLADDSGLCVDALDGAPGIFSARFSGVHGDDAANNRLLLEKLEGHEDRGAHYTCAMVLARPDGSVVEAEGYLYGEIAREEAGSNGFGYDPLFYLPERGCTTAQISSEEKNAISHRANALHALLKKLRAE